MLYIRLHVQHRYIVGNLVTSVQKINIFTFYITLLLQPRYLAEQRITNVKTLIFGFTLDYMTTPARLRTEHFKCSKLSIWVYIRIHEQHRYLAKQRIHVTNVQKINIRFILDYMYICGSLPVNSFQMFKNYSLVIH